MKVVPEVDGRTESIDMEVGLVDPGRGAVERRRPCAGGPAEGTGLRGRESADKSILLSCVFRRIWYLPCPEDPVADPGFQHQICLRVRYSETDQMGTFYNSRALEWFECARTELLRAAGIPYASMEQRGVFLPLVEAHVRYQGRAKYDDELKLTATARMEGKATVRFDVSVVRADDGTPVVSGYTLHAITDASGRPMRTPQWVVDALDRLPKPKTPPLGAGYTDEPEEADDACPFCRGRTCVGACRD